MIIFEFVILLFGLTNAPTIFMDSMNQIFKSYQDIFVMVFINDILIYSQSEEEHMRHLRTVLQTLRNKQLFVKFSKCAFWLKEVTFFVTSYLVKVLRLIQKKTKATKNWSRPLSLSDIKSFGLDRIL